MRRTLLVLLITSLCLPAVGAAQESDPDKLAKSLSNPVAALISVPLQYNYDETYGSNGYKNTLNIQPVIPVSISDNWNMISRTILPVTYQKDVVPGTDQYGLGDTLQSLFFSPKEPTSGGLIWGLGPAILMPSGTDELGAHTWAAGPTAVVLKQTKNWTYGALVNHLWDVGGSGRVPISSTFLQPFLSRNLGKGQTLTFNLESTYDWHANQWTIPVNVMYSKVSRIGTQLVSYAGGVRGYAESPRGGPDWGVRFVVTFLFPR